MKYNLSVIMKTAWNYIREGVSRSQALKRSWREAKQAISYQQWKPYLDHKRDIVAFTYGMERPEVENELYLWFCKVVERYDSGKSCIYTYLESQFRGFVTNMKRQKKYGEREIPMDSPEYIEDRQQERFKDVVNFYYEVNERLSGKAQEVLKFVFDCEFSPREAKDPTRKISREAVIRYFYNLKGWTKTAVKQAWNELSQWWKEFNYAA